MANDKKPPAILPTSQNNLMENKISGSKANNDHYIGLHRSSRKRMSDFVTSKGRRFDKKLNGKLQENQQLQRL